MNDESGVREAQARFWLIARRLEREIASLRDVDERLFPVLEMRMTPKEIGDLIAIPEGRDRLEAFAARFSRVQDGIVDKLLPSFLAASGERTGSVLDNLRRAERLDLLEAPERWLAMRALRNRLVHEYVEDPAELAAALTRAHEMTRVLFAGANAIRSSAFRSFPDEASGG